LVRSQKSENQMSEVRNQKSEVRTYVPINVKFFETVMIFVFALRLGTPTPDP
jgi:hypothetical protein